jgi:hypothetical protein
MIPALTTMALFVTRAKLEDETLLKSCPVMKNTRYERSTA